MNLVVQLIAGALTGAVIGLVGAILSAAVAWLRARSGVTRYQIRSESDEVLTTVEVPLSASHEKRWATIENAISDLESRGDGFSQTPGMSQTPGVS